MSSDKRGFIRGLHGAGNNNNQGEKNDTRVAERTSESQGEDAFPVGEGGAKKKLQFEEGENSTSTHHTDCSGLLATLKNLDNEFSRDTISKLLENIMRKENKKTVLHPKRRQASCLPKWIREKRKYMESRLESKIGKVRLGFHKNYRMR